MQQRFAAGEGKVFYSITGFEVRKLTLERMAAKYKLKFSTKEIEEFGKMTSFGVSMQNLQKFINTEPGQREKFPSGEMVINTAFSGIIFSDVELGVVT